jgi:hypothetical protein
MEVTVCFAYICIITLHKPLRISVRQFNSHSWLQVYCTLPESIEHKHVEKRRAYGCTTK